MLLAAIIFAVWYGFKYIGRLENISDKLRKRHQAARQNSEHNKAPPSAASSDQLDALEMAECRICKKYFIKADLNQHEAQCNASKHT